MGYRKTQRRIEVSLKGHKVYGQDDEYPIAYARGKSLDEYLRLMGYTETEEADERTGIVRQLEEFAGSLVSWNLEREDGTPIPCTAKALFTDVDNDLVKSNRSIDGLLSFQWSKALKWVVNYTWATSESFSDHKVKTNQIASGFMLFF